MLGERDRAGSGKAEIEGNRALDRKGTLGKHDIPHCAQDVTIVLSQQVSDGSWGMVREEGEGKTLESPVGLVRSSHCSSGWE